VAKANRVGPEPEKQAQQVPSASLTLILTEDTITVENKWLRAAWTVTFATEIDPKQVVFVDEISINTSLSVLRAWSPKGQRAYCLVPRNRGTNTTLLSSMTTEGMGPSLVVEGATTAAAFETYVKRVKELIEEKGCELLILLSYSPDLNPTLKRLLPRSRASYGKPRLAAAKH
jgi:hypothetical protein